jgi:hypothetical protein
MVYSNKGGIDIKFIFKTFLFSLDMGFLRKQKKISPSWNKIKIDTKTNYQVLHFLFKIFRQSHQKQKILQWGFLCLKIAKIIIKVRCFFNLTLVISLWSKYLVLKQVNPVSNLSVYLANLYSISKRHANIQYKKKSTKLEYWCFNTWSLNFSSL